ncbi:choice-of-anchor I family protein [Acidovorax sp. JG5]|uniref:choice-of-anchor I family protein n=1 Tax=Acidovorax sp. JG5 TaxID=2822718 RepID=UPI001B32B341|nr:choice-of-anchor I family protein [Acidovorax sp. JG5]MBP3979758.1 choice-of-anchor I family protein [Acidovorax sp. JG5]
MTSFFTSSRRNLFCLSLVAAAALSACGGGDDDFEPTPSTLKLEKIGGYSSGTFLKSAAEIPAFDAASKRAFVVNAQSGKLDVLDLSDPKNPKKVDEVDGTKVLANGEVNSVAVKDGLVAIAIQAKPKTALGSIAIYQASDLKLLGSATVGALPDMLTFTPDGKTVLVANEAEPSDDYQVDPEGSISIVDVSNPASPKVSTADFKAFNSRAAELLAKGVRLFGPNANNTGKATVAQDLEPEYIAVAADGKTAWVTLQENNAMAIVDIAKATVTDIVALGYKDHSLAANALDVADSDGKNPVINIAVAPNVLGMYMPDAISAYKATDGQTYLVTANEGDARAWGENTPAYFGNGAGGQGDVTKGFVEEWRVKNLVHKSGFLRRADDDLPAHLIALAKGDGGALLNPDNFGWCGAIAGDPKTCRDDDQLGRLKVTWTQGYQTNADGSPKWYNAKGVADAAGNRLMYDKLYAYGGRSISIWNDKGAQVWDSGAAIEQFLASDECKLGSKRDIACKTYFNTGHDETATLDARSSAKGPEPEGLTVGTIGNKTFAFVGLERMGGVLVFDITDPKAPQRVDYINTREDWTASFSDKTPPDLSKVGDLGPEGLAFIPAKQSPNGKPLLLVGNEVSGSTAVIQLNLGY